jgi:carbonic anhydrase/acetyltransferase-like protein (isoleucine patch superfamily)
MNKRGSYFQGSSIPLSLLIPGSKSSNGLPKENTTMIQSFEGKTPRIADTAYISKAAHIIGNVEIGDHSSVWPGAVIRGDFGKITIGENCAVEDNCVLHSGSPSYEDSKCDLVIGDNVHIGHGAVLNCHKIGDNVLIGMNATLLHDVEIGNSCIIGAACMVSQGMKIPDDTFVAGVPAKIMGKVKPDQLFWLEQAPKEYTRLVQKYKNT